MDLMQHNSEYVPALPLLKEDAASPNQRGMTVHVYSKLEELPEPYLRLFEQSSEESFFLSLPWFTNFIQTALDPGSSPRIYCVGGRDDCAPKLMLLAQSVAASKGFGSPRQLSALANYYSCFFAPHLAETPDRFHRAFAELARAIRAEKLWDTVEIRALDSDSRAFVELQRAFEKSGFVVQTFFCFGNWYLQVNGRSFVQYMDSLPSVVKNTLQRKARKLEKSGQMKIQIVTGGDELEASIRDYTTVFGESWKQSEPFPDFMPGLIRTCAEIGALRLGLLYIGDEPAAAQLWITENKKASIYKLAYREKFRDLSVGTILTAKLMEQAIDVDRVNEVDYLSGDDAYKKDWMSHRRERWGILAMNPRTPRGALAICRHLGGRSIKRMLNRYPSGSSLAVSDNKESKVAS